MPDPLLASLPIPNTDPSCKCHLGNGETPRGFVSVICKIENFTVKVIFDPYCESHRNLVQGLQQDLEYGVGISFVPLPKFVPLSWLEVEQSSP